MLLPPPVLVLLLQPHLRIHRSREGNADQDNRAGVVITKVESLRGLPTADGEEEAPRLKGELALASQALAGLRAAACERPVGDEDLGGGGA